MLRSILNLLKRIPYSIIYGLEWWNETRRKSVFALFLLTIVFGSTFFYAGIVDNPNIRKNLTGPPVLVSAYGTNYLEIPSFLENGQSQKVRVDCNVTYYYLVDGYPALIDLRVIAPNRVYNFTEVSIIVKNTIAYVSTVPDEIPSSPHSNTIILSSDKMGELEQEWSGNSAIRFQAEGPLKLSFNILMNPADDLWDKVNWTTYESSFSDEISFETIDVQSVLELQQKEESEMNYSLSLIVVFFATVEIAIALYDHSEDKEKSAKYKARKNKKYQNYPDKELAY